MDRNFGKGGSRVVWKVSPVVGEEREREHEFCVQREKSSLLLVDVGNPLMLGFRFRKNSGELDNSVLNNSVDNEKVTDSGSSIKENVICS